jgi:hypothetical protein
VGGTIEEVQEGGKGVGIVADFVLAETDPVQYNTLSSFLPFCLEKRSSLMYFPGGNHLPGKMLIKQLLQYNGGVA